MTVYGRDTVYGTSLRDCTNVVGFDPSGNVFCKPISPTNPTAGLLLRDMSTKNQFFFVYVTFVIDNKADSLLCNYSLLIQRLTPQRFSLSIMNWERGRVLEECNFIKANKFKTRHQISVWIPAQHREFTNKMDTAYGDIANISDTRSTWMNRMHWSFWHLRPGH